jgi:glycosyltransferase involved in cell wall biosynthesis
MSRALIGAVRREKPDLVHAWDWPQALDAYYAVHLPLHVPLAVSIMSMVVLTSVPQHIPITMGTEELVDEARRRRRGPVELLEPPVDTARDNPTAVDASEFKQQWGLDDSAVTVVVVSRLVKWLKQESLERAIDAIEQLAPEHAARLVIVGDGSAAAELQQRADAVNARLGRNAVILTGALIDPRPAYAAADVTIGMGGSILRGMAFGKPCVVLGEQGFSDVFEPSTAKMFFWQGYYGLGNSDLSPEALTHQLRRLVASPALRAELGRFSLDTIERRYALAPLAADLDALYRTTVDQHVARSVEWTEAARLGARRFAAGALHLTRRARAAAGRGTGS